MKSTHDARLEQVEQKLVWMSEMLLLWLDENHGCSSGSIFFLCGVLVGLIQDGWPDGPEQPQVYSDLLRAIERLAVELGPAVMTLELQALAGQTRPKKTRHKVRATIN